jgi:hypothetical protein
LLVSQKGVFTWNSFYELGESSVPWERRNLLVFNPVFHRGPASRITRDLRWVLQGEPWRGEVLLLVQICVLKFRYFLEVRHKIARTTSYMVSLAGLTGLPYPVLAL